MRVAAIDIGTNTILMLIADVDRNNSLRVIRDEHAIARLGEGVDDSKRIAEKAVERALTILEQHRSIADREKVERIVACGTSALRDATNRDEVVELVRERVGINIEVISGEEEAELTYTGAVSVFIAADRQYEFLVLDIGGGSTELTYGKGLSVKSRSSLDVGCVRLTERVLRSAPPTIEALHAAQSLIRDHISNIKKQPSARMIGVAGTLTTLAALDLNLKYFDPMKVGGHLLSLENVKSVFQKFSRMTVDEIAAFPQVLPGRADVLLAGVMILVEVMETLGANEITVSERGLRYGLAMREVSRM